MAIKKTRKEADTSLSKPVDPSLKDKIEALYAELEAAGVRRQVLDHLQEAFFHLDPNAA